MGNDKKKKPEMTNDDSDAFKDSTNIPYDDPKLEKSRIYHTVSKWQRASVRLTQAKIDLENLLESFDEYERKDERYAELFQTVEFMLNNIKEHYKPHVKEKETEEKKEHKFVPEWVNFKNALITLAVTIIVTFTNNFEAIIQYILHLFK